MNIAILHYHFDRGGVTSIVRSIIDGFAGCEDVQFALISGRPVEDIPTPSETIPGLDYEVLSHPRELYQQVTAAARKLFSGSLPDVWHVHNPALGKNRAMVGLVAELARNGHPLLLHQHDFAEDFRPSNYQLREESRAPKDPVFPYASHVRFATINQRDTQILQRAGMPASYGITLTNPVRAKTTTIEHQKQSQLILYPVRALARKNFGELLLLATALKGEYEFATTLPPTNPHYLHQFEKWKQLCTKFNIPVRLAVAKNKKEKLEEWIAKSAAIFTTSVAEGFGLSFLESWQLQRPVCGRDLPEITTEFMQNGVMLNHLYKTLDVPLELTSIDSVRSSLLEGIQESHRIYRRKVKTTTVDNWLSTLGNDGKIDFSLLNVNQQEDVIEKISTSHNHTFVPSLNIDLAAKSLKHNQDVISRKYSTCAYCKRLFSVYEEIAGSPTSKINHANPDTVLDGFLNIRRYRPHFR